MASSGAGESDSDKLAQTTRHEKTSALSWKHRLVLVRWAMGPEIQLQLKGSKGTEKRPSDHGQLLSHTIYGHKKPFPVRIASSGCKATPHLNESAATSQQHTNDIVKNN